MRRNHSRWQAGARLSQDYLPNYGVFDENRYFRAGKGSPIYTIAGVGVGVNICEDIWYEGGPTTVQAYSGLN